jgi:hypothetical protein
MIELLLLILVGEVRIDDVVRRFVAFGRSVRRYSGSDSDWRRQRRLVEPERLGPPHLRGVPTISRSLLMSFDWMAPELHRGASSALLSASDPSCRLFR